MRYHKEQTAYDANIFGQLTTSAILVKIQNSPDLQSEFAKVFKQLSPQERTQYAFALAAIARQMVNVSQQELK